MKLLDEDLVYCSYQTYFLDSKYTMLNHHLMFKYNEFNDLSIHAFDENSMQYHYLFHYKGFPEDKILRGLKGYFDFRDDIIKEQFYSLFEKYLIWL